MVNFHNSKTIKYESENMRKIEYGKEIMLKNDKYTAPITFEFTPERKTNQINVFESHKKCLPQ